MIGYERTRATAGAIQQCEIITRPSICGIIFHINERDDMIGEGSGNATKSAIPQCKSTITSHMRIIILELEI